MTFKSTLSMVALVTAITCTNAFAVRVANPRVVKELKAFYQKMEAEGRLGELSKSTKQICSCLEEGSDHDGKALIKAVKEVKSHGHVIRSHVPSGNNHVNRHR